jgi:DNA-binding IclR family transcriptional regulator
MNGIRKGRKPARGEPVLDRAFRILTAFGPADRALSLTALSLRADLPKPTALRLARKLTQWGALERTGDGTYVIGLRLHATGQHVILAVRDGHHAVLVERLSARGAGRVMYRVGGRMPLHSTGVGHVLLAHAPVDVQEEELAGDLTVAPENIQLTAADLRIRLAAVRRDGVAVVSRPQPEPMTSVASAIFSHDRTPVAAVSVITRTTAEPLALAPAVIAVARAISRATA